MGIEDIQISEELETNAPSIKYSGNEGPKSPQQMQEMIMAQLEEEYSKYVDDMMEQGIEPMSMQQFMEQAMAEGQMSSAQPMAPQAMPPRQMAAYGGIMGMDGRRQYGIGSSLKKFARKIIPNEVAEIAVKAAPFVAPFNPLAAGLMSGIGSFDQTGRIGSSLKSGLMNYGLGNIARMAGGAGFQKGFTNPNAAANAGFMDKYLSSPYVKGDDIFSKTKERFFPGGDEITKSTEVLSDNKFSKAAEGTLSDPREKLDFIKNTKSSNLSLLDRAKDFAINNKLATFLLAKEGLDLLSGPEETVSEIMDRGEKLDIKGIRAEVQEAFKDQTGEKLAALRVKYPFLGRRDTKDIANMAMGGRTRRAEGGLMDLGGMEKDYRAEGGFVPIGREEKADDVPARLSVNEFVFTADAVRNAGGGDIDKGAEIMENMMKNLEQGGQVSEESQGMAGAQQMFATSERLSEVM
jgi:hypothetical protein